MHRWSQLFIPTLREFPADAEVASHKLLLRGGYVRQLGAGLYSYLFLGNRSINKIVAIIREEMNTIGQEFFLPALMPRELWEESGRWASMGQNMFRLTDRKGADLCLGMTHEEAMTAIARDELRSYKQLPQIWYQIQTKFRDEPRPKSGLLRVRQFLMKDAYSFDLDAAGLDQSYAKHDAVYRRIFTRCGLDFLAVEADSGSMGGSQSQEFMVYTEAGEDLIASSASGYAANLERASSSLAPVENLPPTGDGTPELIATPGMGAIADICAFLDISPVHDIKCVAFMGQRTFPDDTREKPVVAFLRGDHQVNETKLQAATSSDALRPMIPEELTQYLNAPAGFLGPVGLTVLPAWAAKYDHGFYTAASLAAPKGLNSAGGLNAAKQAQLLNPHATTVILDAALIGRENMIAGANQLDFHLRNVSITRDVTATSTEDIRNVQENEPDPIDGSPLRIGKAVEIGHIFKLGYKYSESMGARVLNAAGKEVTPIMGSYGIGVERILTAAIEQSAAIFAAREVSSPSDPERAMRPEGTAERPASSSSANPTYALPPSIAPFTAVVTVTNVREDALRLGGEQVALALEAAGLDVLLDDRDERAGVKFKDADIIGIPFRITIGKRFAEGFVEFTDRLRHESANIPTTDIASHLAARISAVNIHTAADLPIAAQKPSNRE
jgi:prolyl-tRNA synthetase